MNGKAISLAQTEKETPRNIKNVGALLYKLYILNYI